MKKRALAFKAAGVVLSVLPTLLAVAEWFPFWAAQGGRVAVSGLSAVLLCLAFAPLMRLVRRHLPAFSLWPFWLYLWAVLVLVRRVSDGLIAVSAVSFAGGLAGAVFYRIGEYLEKK